MDAAVKEEEEEEEEEEEGGGTVWRGEVRETDTTP